MEGGMGGGEMNAWMTKEVAPDILVLPIDDIRNHTDAGTQCWCEPRIQIEKGKRIVIHDAKDGRE